jgi:hypothetical protein
MSSNFALDVSADVRTTAGPSSVIVGTGPNAPGERGIFANVIDAEKLRGSKLNRSARICAIILESKRFCEYVCGEMSQTCS